MRRCDNLKAGPLCVLTWEELRVVALCKATRVRHVRIDSISVPLTVRDSWGFSVERQSTRLEVPEFLGTEPLFLGCRGKRNTCGCGLVRAMKRPSLCLRA